MGFKIGIVGATGAVGRTMLEVLEKSSVPVSELRLFASERSAGQILTFRGADVRVETLTQEAMREGFDYLLFSAGADVSRRYAPIAAEVGTTVIDNSSAFRMVPEIPLVVPEINGHLLKGYRGIVANPNCSTIQMVLALYKVHDKYQLHEIFVSTYQAVSGAGHKAIVEYERQLSGDDSHSVFVRQIAHNVIPLIGDLKDDISQEEWKMINETKKILNSKALAVFPTTVRVPVRIGHSESVIARTLFPIMSKEDLIETIASGEDVVVHDDIVTPLEVAGDDYVHVSRVRLFDAQTFGLWVVADNLRVGAATNAVRILKLHSELNNPTVEREVEEVERR
ncbi:aspartate semialdehyde dehydrogenase [Fervidobacterium changbaicum]|uniref:Aspartate-semialdehyde dehydrogenase n=2 Tax=Fervidobacterium TaxID=2422 RepID=A0AAI8CKT5_FERIS|nr:MULTISPECIES: aspartate-semialdehyde dehydrogenase [Fervidobacterium]AMW32170.1 aspartate-semialdehyde dehydrogenase [Fervidobacterium islandicum]QAV32498.1 aspartate-semialdehyde dehydrogenase [Fervidobacterium changbaicum]SDH57622.1 aspartate semialdehyde dehydrogenase [Fervidobacterium changbaicum]